MPVQDADTLKSYFTLAQVPTPSQYIDLIDTMLSVGGGGEWVPLSRMISVSGLGLSGGGDLNNNRTISLESSSNPGINSKILASDTSGQLTIEKLFLGTDQDVSLYRNGVSELATDDQFTAMNNIQTTENFKLWTAGKAILFGNSGGTFDVDLFRDSANTLSTHSYLWVQDSAWIDAGFGVGYLESNFNPGTNYLYNLGDINKKYLSLHVAELWVETLVAASVMATIGGQIVVAPTTKLHSDLGLPQNLITNSSFENWTGNIPDNWSVIIVGDGQVYPEDAPYVHSGTYAAIVYNGSSVTFTRLEQGVNITSGQIFTLSFWTRGISGRDGEWYIWDGTNNVFLAGPYRTDVHTDSWYKVMYTIYIPPGTNFVNIGFAGDMDYAGSYFTVDDVCFGVDVFSVEDNQMAVNDIVYLSGGGQAEWIRILGGPYDQGGYYNYYIERGIEWEGGRSWLAGSAVLNTGQTGDGYIDLYSTSGIFTSYGPTITGWVRYSNDWHWQVSAAWAIGNLRGLYGYITDLYGACFGLFKAGEQNICINHDDGIWMGTYNGGSSWTTRFQVTNQGVMTINNGAGSPVFSFNASTGASFELPLTLGTNGGIYQGSSGDFWTPGTGIKLYRDPGTGSGVLAGYNATIEQFRADTDGKLKAAGGYIWMDVDGFHLKNSSWGEDTHMKLKFYSPDGDLVDTIGIWAGAGGSYAHIGPLRVNPQVGTYIQGPLLVTGGLESQTDITADGQLSTYSNFWYAGDLKAYRNSTDYIGYIYVPLATPVVVYSNMSWSYDIQAGNSRDYSNMGIPAGSKAVDIEILVRYDSTISDGFYFCVGPTDTYWYQVGVSPQANGVSNRGAGLVNVVNNKVYFRTHSSTPTSLIIWWRVWGYWI